MAKRNSFEKEYERMRDFDAYQRYQEISKSKSRMAGVQKEAQSRIKQAQEEANRLKNTFGCGGNLRTRKK